MVRWAKQLDRILRGEATSLPALRQGTIDVPAGGLSAVLAALGMVYGICMGVYALTHRWGTPDAGAGYQQMLASTLKVPLLFFLTLLVTFPSLYVFNALVGSRLTLVSVLRLLVAAMGVMLAVLASFGTITAFFAISTESYHFMTLLNVVMFGIAGVLGLAFLLRTLHRLTVAQEPEVKPTAEPLPLPPVTPISESAEQVVQVPPALRPGALDRLQDRTPGPNITTIFRIWVIVFGLVGGQMAWVLRPFIGSPNQPFSWFRPRESNFFEAVLRSLQHLFS